MASFKEKIVLDTKFGKIIEFDDTRFGGKEYVVFDKNGDFVEKFINFNKAKDCLYSMKENKITDVKGIVNKILEGVDVREVLCNKLDEGFSEEFKQEIINNPVNKKIKQIAEKYGYAAKETFLYWYGGIHCSISPKDYNDFHPEVSISSDLDDDSVVEYRIQTTSYGALSLDDYKEFLKCCDDAYNMMKEISELDLTKLAKEVKSE